jgi:aspartyl-tRNA synthetase
LEHVGQEVTLCGWVDTYRDHSGVLFIDLRDRYGKTQVVFAPEAGDETLQASKSLRSEFVVLVRGKVAPRPEGTVNPKLDTGQIELRAAHLEILNRSLTPPFQPTGKELPGEDLRLKHRYIDLRRPEMQRTMLLRNRMIKIMRDYCHGLGFVDVETPMLGRSTPEGARDYLVPSRVQPGTFYALPQSPQLYKQILMVAGFDRYIQVARCFRDEDLRADRQPEFTQLDLEMSFIDADDIMGVIEGLVTRLAKEVLGLDLPLPLPRMTYDGAVRPRRPRSSVRHGAHRHHRFGQRGGVQGVPRRRRCGRPRARHQRQGCRRSLLAQGHRRIDGVRGRKLRREGTRLVQGRGGRTFGFADRQELQP